MADTLKDLAASLKLIDKDGLSEVLTFLKEKFDTQKKEVVNIDLGVSTNGTASDLNGAVVTIKERETGRVLWTGTWAGQTLTAILTAEWRYMIEFGNVSGYATPVYQRYNAVFGNTRQITAEYMYLSDAVESFYIDDNINDPATKISGVVNGTVVQWIRNHSHRYLMKKTGEGYAAICQLDDSDSNLFFDGITPAILTGAQGDVIVKWPIFYYDVNEVSPHKWEIQLAVTNVTGNMIAWDTNQVIGAYEGYVLNGKLYSRSGVPSTGSVSQANFKAYARARGAGYTIMKWIQHNIHAMLFYSKYGHTGSQEKLGYGTDSYDKQTGQTNSLGMEDTVRSGNGDSGSINNWGLENSHGNKAEWIDNVTVDYNANGNIFYITEDDGTVRNVVTQTGANAHVWPTKMILGKKFDLIAAPDNVVGGDSIGYCDGFYLSNASARVVCVSNNYAHTNGGVAFSYAYYVASSTNASIGARLAFKGTLTEYNDISAFIELSEQA